MAKIQIPALTGFPDYVEAANKLDRIRTRVAALQRECQAEPPAPIAEPTVDELAEVFLDNGPDAVPAAIVAQHVAARDLSAVYRDLAIAKRAAEIQEAVVAEILLAISEKICVKLEPEFQALADAIATKLFEAAELARQAKPLYDRLCSAGYRQPLWMEQRQLGVDLYAKTLASELDPKALGFGIGPILRVLVATGLISKDHPGARAAKIS